MRGYLFIGLFVFACTILFLKLFYVQVIQGPTYRLIADTNRVRTTLIHAPRGVIFDRTGMPLVYNVPGFRELINGKTKIISQKDALDLLAKGDKSLEVDSLRSYPLKDATAHIIGYLGQISDTQLEKPKYKQGYHVGDLIGEMGIETSYESVLRGVDGKQLLEVDATGKPVRTLGQTDPIPGENVTLTLDGSFQKSVFDAMKTVSKGAAIVSTPKGEVLAMVSKPSFDPNIFSLGKRYQVSGNDQYKTISDVLLDGTNQPLLNRVISGQYPPGSTFKIVAATAALEDKVISPNFTIEDTGVLKVGNFSFANWYYTEYGKKEGTVDVVKALQRSNDIFFYEIGQKLGVDRLSATARSFGAGNLLGIDLPGEEPGLVPTKEWKKRVIGEDWYLGDDYHYGIGQGYLLTTPLQVNAWTQAIANKGTLYLPHLVQADPHMLATHPISDGTFNLVRQGMIAACSPGGVAFPLFNFTVKNPKLAIDGRNILSASNATTSGNLADYRQISVACKTGTAETSSGSADPHAWLTLFAPAYNPQVIVTVLVENSGEGSAIAGPIAKEILTSWFQR